MRLDVPPTHTRAHADSMRRETSAVRSSAYENNLSGTLPAALGALTDLVVLCARPPIPRGGEGPARPRSRRVGALTRVCGAAQLPGLERLDRHDRRLDRLAGEAHILVRPRPHVHGGYRGGGARALLRRVLLGVLEYSAPWGLRCDLRCASVCVCACVRPQTHALAYTDTYRHSVSNQAFLAEHICRCIRVRMGRQIDVYIESCLLSIDWCWCAIG
jgi:hypothetical protein